MNEDDAVRAALSQYYDNSRPAGYAASFRAGWDAGRVHEVGLCTHGREVAEERDNLLGKIKMWEALAEEKNWGYVHDERLDRLVARARIVSKMFDEIEDALRALLGLTKAEMKIASVVQWARNALERVEDETPACQDCGMRHEPDDQASCIEGHGTDVEWGEDSAAQQLERGPR